MAMNAEANKVKIEVGQKRNAARATAAIRSPEGQVYILPEERAEVTAKRKGYKPVIRWKGKRYGAPSGELPRKPLRTWEEIRWGSE